MSQQTTIELGTLIAILGSIFLPMLALVWQMANRLVQRVERLTADLRVEHNARIAALEQADREAPHQFAARDDFVREFQLLRRDLRTLMTDVAELRGAQAIASDLGARMTRAAAHEEADDNG